MSSDALAQTLTIGEWRADLRTGRLTAGGEVRTVEPKVMDLLEIPHTPDAIRMFNYGGVDKALDLLVQYIVTPQLGAPILAATHPTHLLHPYISPPQRFLLVADPEGKFRDQHSLAHQKQKRIDSIVNSTPAELKDAMRRELSVLIEMTSWGAAFEFAHLVTHSRRTHADSVPLDERL